MHCWCWRITQFSRHVRCSYTGWGRNPGGQDLATQGRHWQMGRRRWTFLKLSNCFAKTETSNMAVRVTTSLEVVHCNTLLWLKFFAVCSSIFMAHHYHILCLQQTASHEEIRLAFKRRALQETGSVLSISFVGVYSKYITCNRGEVLDLCSLFISGVVEQPVQQASAKTTATKKEEKKSNSTKHYGENENNTNSNIQRHTFVSFRKHIWHILSYPQVLLYLKFAGLRIKTWKKSLVLCFFVWNWHVSSAGDFQVHPDKGGTKDAFHQVYQAFDVLSNPQRRRKWLDRNSFTLLVQLPNKASYQWFCQSKMNVLLFLLSGWGIDFVEVC